MFVAPQNIVGLAHNVAVKADDLGIGKKCFFYVHSGMASMLGYVIQQNAIWGVYNENTVVRLTQRRMNA